MRNPIKQLEERKIRNLLRRHYDPAKPFMELLRSDFKRSVELEIKPARTPLHHHVIRWRYALIAALIGVSSMAGMMTYADATNVPPTHPLYQFKRMSEQIRLDFSTPQQQVQLRQAFAERRAHEIKELQEASESMEMIPSLINDFQQETDQTIEQAQRLNFKKDQRKVICESILSSVDHALNPQRLLQIQTHCQALSQ